MSDMGGNAWFTRWFGMGGAAPLRDGSFQQGDDGAGSSAPEPGTGDVLQARGSYRIEHRLGHGASGSVWLARRIDAPEAEQAVAIKVLAPNPDGDQEITFKRELSALLAIDTPRIPRVLDWHLAGERPFVVMPFFPKGSLRDLLMRIGSMPEQQCWELLRDLLEALVAAHQASVLHLDIKPANVLIDADDRYVLTDFGISQGTRITTGALPIIGTGTPGYRAPEQRWLDPDHFDMRTDLYSVGATVWAAFTGLSLASKRSAPLLSKSPADKHGAPPMSKLRPFCSPELEDTVMSLLVQDRSQRPGSAAEVLARVEKALGLGSAEPPARGTPDPDGAKKVVTTMMDPLWTHLFAGTDGEGVRRFGDGEPLAVEGERAWHAFILLKGSVRIAKNGRHLANETREGTFLGEVATLTGGKRTASMIAQGDVWVHVLNASQLEWVVTSNPAVGIRLIRSMAERLARSG